jgi:hypothetical protein
MWKVLTLLCQGKASPTLYIRQHTINGAQAGCLVRRPIQVHGAIMSLWRRAGRSVAAAVDGDGIGGSMALTADEVVSRSKRAVRTWASMTVNAPVSTGDSLSKFRNEVGLLDLLTKVNDAFSDQTRFPISPVEWQNPLPQFVKDVCDKAQKKVVD